MTNYIFLYSLIVVRLLRLLFLVILSGSQESLFLDWELIKINEFSLNIPILLDVYSGRFLSTVSTIAACIYLFSLRYIGAEVFFLRFHLLVFSFIVSIVLLILRPHLIRILLGWDGLGITSYLLVIYFQRTKSFNAGMVTALSNRIGDVLLLISVGLLASEKDEIFLHCQILR